MNTSLSKLIFLALVLVINSDNAFANLTDHDYVKNVKGDEGLIYSLSLSSKPVEHLFDALPKLRVYQYTGTKAAHVGKAFKRVVYPDIFSTQDNFKLQYNLPTANDGEMLVEIMDLSLSPSGAKAIWLSTFEQMYAAANAANADFIESEGAGLRVSHATKLKHAYLSFRKNDKSQFVALHNNRYLITLTLTNVSGLTSCTNVESYVQPYVQNVNTNPLDQKSN
jgi:hypothetical protein